jgi:S-adenosylmethionine-dependent methyltransferase
LPHWSDTTAVFDDHVEAWQQWQQSPWGTLRYRVVGELLARHLADLPPQRVLDVGGADGADSVPLAAAGHDVVVVDQSARMLSLARRRAAAKGVTITTVQAGLDALPASPNLTVERPTGGAAVVLAHNVLQYCASLEPAVARVVACAVPGGLVSLMVTNPVNHVLRAVVRDLDPDAALSALDAETFPTVTFGHDVRAITWQQGVEALRRHGCDVVARYGVLCVNHLVTADDRKTDPAFAASLERLELALADRDPYRDIASMWLVLARRR